MRYVENQLIVHIYASRVVVPGFASCPPTAIDPAGPLRGVGRLVYGPLTEEVLRPHRVAKFHAWMLGPPGTPELSALLSLDAVRRPSRRVAAAAVCAAAISSDDVLGPAHERCGEGWSMDPHSACCLFIPSSEYSQ